LLTHTAMKSFVNDKSNRLRTNASLAWCCHCGIHMVPITALAAVNHLLWDRRQTACDGHLYTELSQQFHVPYSEYHRPPMCMPSSPQCTRATNERMYFSIGHVLFSRTHVKISLVLRKWGLTVSMRYDLCAARHTFILWNMFGSVFLLLSLGPFTACFCPRACC